LTREDKVKLFLRYTNTEHAMRIFGDMEVYAVEVTDQLQEEYQLSSILGEEGGPETYLYSLKRRKISCP
jgi:hypothetical protein